MSNIIKGKKIFSPQVGGSSVSWGGIGGTLALQLDLQAALDAKANNTLTLSTTAPLAGGGDLTANRTLSITQASGSTDGYLSAANWTTFNGKESALTFSSPLSRSTNTISIPAATTSVNGYLTSTDWTTFNGKQNAITLTTTGTSGAATFVANTLNIPQYAGGLTYFTEAQNTSAPNATVYVDSLTAVSTTTNADFVIKPKGSGSILANIPDNLATGGNKRGTYAVDLQMSRTVNTQVASGDYSFIAGQNNIASNTNSVAIGLQNNSSGTQAVAIGQQNSASGTQSVAIGLQNSATVQQAVAIGYLNTANGGYSFAAGYSNTASSDAAIALGHSSTASGSQSVAIGRGCTSNATQSVSIGVSSYASGSGAVALGNLAYATGQNSLATGYGSNTNSIIGRWSHSSNYITSVGENQKSVFVLLARTTGNTLTALSSNNAAASATNQLNLQNNNSIRFKGTIIARQSGSTNTAAWDIDGIIQRGTTAASTTLLISNVTLVQNTPAWGTPTLVANTTLGGLTVNVTGVATTNIMWVATIDTTEVIYA